MREESKSPDPNKIKLKIDREEIMNSELGEKPIIVLKSWRPVAFWSLDMKIETCAICRNHIIDTCVGCQNGTNKPDDDECIFVVGECGHAFHSHCIFKWLKKKAVCPLDSKKWICKEDKNQK